MSWDIWNTNYLVFQNDAGKCCSQLSRNFSRSRLNIVMNDIAIIMFTWQQKWSLEVYGTIWMNDVFANWIFILENCKMMAIWIDVAHLVFLESKFCHITPFLKTLLCLPFRYRIVFIKLPKHGRIAFSEIWSFHSSFIFKVLLITFKAIHGLAPSFISNLISVKDMNGRYTV